MSYAPLPMVPGPVTLHPKVLEAMRKDYGSGQIEEDFIGLYDATARKFARLMGTKIKNGNDVVLMTGEGMLALWGALKSCLRPKDRVATIGTGIFGDGFADMAESLGCEVTKISLPYNSTIPTEGKEFEALAEKLAIAKPKMLIAVHCETPSGTLNPLEAVGKLKHELGIPLFVVDAVASLGGAPVCMDDWHVDLMLGGSQKCLSAPPSMSMLGVSAKAWECIREVGYQGYDAILPFATVRQDGRCPYTPYWHGMAAIHAAAEALLEEGLEAVFARHEAVALQCRKGLKEQGFSLWTEEKAINSPTVTAAMIPAGYTWQSWQSHLKKKGLIVAGSFGPMAGKVFRLGHMGVQAQEWMMKEVLEILGDF